jgi:hypothetical protein
MPHVRDILAAASRRRLARGVPPRARPPPRAPAAARSDPVLASRAPPTGSRDGLLEHAERLLPAVASP